MNGDGGKAIHILFLADNFPPEVNASASRIFERAVYWVEWGHTVTVVTAAPNFPQGKIYPGYTNAWYHVEWMSGIRVVRVKTYVAPNRGVFRRIIDFLSFMIMGSMATLFQKNVDVIVVSSPPLFTVLGACIVATLRRKPFVFELADLWPASIVAVGAMRKNVGLRYLEKLELFLYHRATRVIALTEAFKKNLTARGITAEKIAVIRNGAELRRYYPIQKSATLMRELHLENQWVIAYIGTQGMAHDLMQVLEVADRLRDSNISFLFVGDGANHDDLVDAAEKRALTNVIFVPQQAKAMMPQYWSVADIALVHLKADPLFATVIPSKLFEAVAMGKPILYVGPQGEASQLVEQEAWGWSLPPGQTLAFVELLKKLNSERETVLAMSSRLAASACAYSREQQAKKFLEILETINNRK